MRRKGIIPQTEKPEKGLLYLEGIERPKALEKLKETLAPSNYYYFNPEFDKKRLRS